jgi:trypsin
MTLIEVGPAVAVGACMTIQRTLSGLFGVLALAQAITGCAIAPSDPNNVEESPEAVPDLLVGGSDFNIRTVPWQVSFSDPGGGHYCGGTILNASWVLTAAHCKPKAGDKVTAGTTSLSAPAQVRTIGRAVIKPEYKGDDAGGDVGHDLALVKLLQPLQLGPNVMAVSFEKTDAAYKDGVSGVISGWGNKVYLGDTPDKLQGASVKVKAPAADDFQMTDIVGLIAPGVSACHGDSGGPFVVRQNGSPVLAGVSSFVPVQDDKACVAGLPSYYTKTSSHAAWLTSTIASGGGGSAPDPTPTPADPAPTPNAGRPDALYRSFGREDQRRPMPFENLGLMDQPRRVRAKPLELTLVPMQQRPMATRYRATRPSGLVQRHLPAELGPVSS